MLLYTIFPEEYIFADEPSEEKSSNQAAVEIKKGQVSLMVQPLSGGRSQIIRVISTDSQDYLKPEWQPGMII